MFYLLIFMVLGKNSDIGKKKTKNKKKKTRFSSITWLLARFKENGPKKGPGLYGRERVDSITEKWQLP